MNNRLPRAARMAKKSDFNAVFAKPVRFSDRFFTLLVRAKADQQQARLGLAVAKKSVRYAVGRNRIKRLIRESFRHQQLCHIDVVVIAKPATGKASNSELSNALGRLWQRVVARFDNSSFAC